MYSFQFELECFETLSIEEKVEVIRAALGALVLANTFFLLRRPDFPDVYASGVRYVAEPPGRDNWQDAPRTLTLWRTGTDGGDCEDLASWRVAWLRARGVDRGADVHVVWRKIGNFTLFHIMVRRSDGRIEDPSLDLGME